MSRVFISERIDWERMPFRGTDLLWGAAHYSWKLVSLLYHNSFKEAGIETRDIVRPEIYQSEVARRILDVGERDVHLAVKPVEHLRPFHGIANLFVCGWEFPEFSDKAYNDSPMLNQLSILRRADRVICWTDFTRDNLRAAGLDNAVTLPPVVPEAKGSDREAALDMPSLTLNSFDSKAVQQPVPLRERMKAFEGATIFTAVLNPHDRRKQLPTLLEGFRQAADEGGDMRLVIKLVIDNKNQTLSQINTILNEIYDYRAQSQDVIFCSAQLDDAAMAGFRELGDFYTGAPSAEGLNLPAIEAALAGVPLILPLNTAMGTYLKENQVVPVAFRQETASGRINVLVDHMEFTHFPPTPQGMCDAFLAAERMDASERKAMADRARRAIASRFGVKRFARDFTALLDEVA